MPTRLAVLLLLQAALCCCAPRGAGIDIKRARMLPLETVGADLAPAAVSPEPRLVLVNFWAPWCASCLLEMPSLHALHARFRGRGFAVIAVATDTAESDLRNFLSRDPFRLPLVFDRDGSVKEAFGVRGLPRTVLLDIDRGRSVFFPHPETGEPVDCYNGPARWDSRRFTAFIGDYLE